MRGKDAFQRKQLHEVGITPACAGKRGGMYHTRQSRGDHPRVCGEKASPVFFALFLSGSPPRVRGKVSAGATLPRLGGITPACAGKSCAGCVAAVTVKDHPRVCGEKLRWMRCRCHSKGSPPRVRGKEPLRAITICCARITPACAGKRQHTCGPCGCQGDHPRVCGEKGKCHLGVCPTVGSPPRVRGKGRAHRPGA